MRGLFRLAGLLAVGALLALGRGPARAEGQGLTPAAVSAPVLKWQRGGCFTSWCQTGWYASPAVADLDKDGQAEVIWGAYDVVALTGATGAEEWRAANASRVWPSIAVADLTGDGTLEVIVGRSGDQLTVYNASGGVVWARNPFGNGEVRTLAVADLELDGQMDIVVGRASGGSTKQLHAFDAVGNPRAGWPARRDGEAGYGWGMYNQNVAVGDLTGDGLKEVIGPTDTHYITALDRHGNQLGANAVYGAGKVWAQVGVHVDHAVDLRGYANCGSEHRPNFANSAPLVADVDANGQREIVVIGNIYNCGANPYQDLYEIPYILKVDRTRWAAGAYNWTVLPTPAAGAAPLSEDYNVIESVVPNPVVADLDGDGRREILYPSYDGRLHAFWLDKTQHGNWPVEITQGGEGFIRFASEPAVADLDNDGQAEVLVATWTQKGSNAGGQLLVISAAGNVLHAVALPRSTSNWDGAMAAPTIANIDGDADYEVVIGTAHMGVVAYDLPGSAGARLLWGTGRGTYARSGLAPECTPAAAQGTAAPPLTGPVLLFLPLVNRGC